MNDFRDEYRKADSVLVDVPVTAEDFAALTAARRARLIQHQEFLGSLPRVSTAFPDGPVECVVIYPEPGAVEAAPCPY